MEVMILLIPMSVVLVLVIAAAFVWSVRRGQFDDLEGPAWRILADDDAVAVPRAGPVADALAPANTVADGPAAPGPRAPLTSINPARRPHP